MNKLIRIECIFLIVYGVSGFTKAKSLAQEPIDIGSRREFFVDDYLIEKMDGVELRLHSPTPREVVLVTDKPWEGNACAYFTVFKDDELYRMYYRGSHTEYTPGKIHDLHRQVTCYAESKDGIHWSKPKLELFEFNGSKKNNIIWDGIGTHNFTPFKDTNPACKQDEKYKALGSGKGGLMAFKSPDGIHWSLMSDEPVITKGAFDSQNLGFWDSVRGEYREYHRDFRDGRDIRTATSKDFLHWTDPVWLNYFPERSSQLYTNQVTPYYRAPHIFLGFPTRYIDRGWTKSTEVLPQLEYRRIRASKSQREGTALTDGMFMTSRDGLNFKIWPESFIRPGIQRPGNWFYGDNYQNWGIVETKSNISGAPKELSVYATESYAQGESMRLRRYTLRIDGFVSVHAPPDGGEFVTKPFVFEGSKLVMNFSTSAAGSIQVEIQDADGNLIDGFTLPDCQEIYGDDLDRVVAWKGDSDLSKLASKPISLRFVMKDADLYSIQFCP